MNNADILRYATMALPVIAGLAWGYYMIKPKFGKGWTKFVGGDVLTYPRVLCGSVPCKYDVRLKQTDLIVEGVEMTAATLPWWKDNVAYYRPHEPK